MLKKSWEIIKGKRKYYVDIQKNLVVVGSTLKQGITDIAGQCTLEQFYNGEFHDVIKKDFGEKVLKEVISIVEKLL